MRPITTIELFPSDDHCVQGCADCPKGRKKTDLTGSQPYYGDRAMQVLGKINELTHIDSIILGPHHDRQENQDLAALPKIDGLEQVSVAIGSIDEFEDAEFPAIVKRVSDDVAKCLENQSKDFALNLNFSVVPDLDDELLPTDERIHQFFTLLLDEIASDTYPVLLKHLLFGLSHNDVNRQAMELIGKDFAMLQKIQRYIHDMAHELAVGRGRVLSSKTNTEEYATDEMLCYRNFTELEVEKFCKITVGQRLVEENKGKTGRGLKELDLKSGSDFNIALFSDHAWHYHSKDMVSDGSLIMPYDELEVIIDECDDTTNLRKEINKAIMSKRRMKVI